MTVMSTMEGALIYVITQLEVLTATVMKVLSYKMIHLPVEVRVIVKMIIPVEVYIVYV